MGPALYIVLQAGPLPLSMVKRRRTGQNSWKDSLRNALDFLQGTTVGLPAGAAAYRALHAVKTGTKRPFRGPGSMSQTKRRRRAVDTRAAGTGGFFSGIRYRARNPKRMGKFWKALMQPRSWRNSDGLRLTCTSGTQGVDYMPVGISTDYTEPFGILDGAGNPTAKAFIMNWQGEMRITNQDKGNCELTIYSVVPRRSMQGTGTYTPTGAWSQGLTDTNGTSATTKATSNLGVTPYEAPEFCSLYKIVKRQKFILAQGQSHVHKFNFKLNKVFTKDEWESFGQYRNFSHFFLFVVNGMPYNDATTKTLVASGSCAIDIVKIAKLTYRGINDQASYYQYTNGQDTITTESVMDIGQGEAETDAAA